MFLARAGGSGTCPGSLGPPAERVSARVELLDVELPGASSRSLLDFALTSRVGARRTFHLPVVEGSRHSGRRFSYPASTLDWRQSSLRHTGAALPEL